jgi:hypothetical protein
MKPIKTGPKHRITQGLVQVTSTFQPSAVNAKLDRIMSHVDAKLYKVKAEILKWFLGTALIQVITHFSISHWGL